MLEIIVLPLSTTVTCKETRAAIIALQKNGFTGKDIVATKIAPKSTIYRIIKNFKKRGSILVKKASGRPRKSSKRQDRLLKRIQLRDRSAISAELAQEWQQAGVNASARTVRRRLLEDGLVSRRAAKKPLLSKKNIRHRLIFFRRKYGEWTAEDWGKVIFSDEACFQLFGASGKRPVRRRKGLVNSGGEMTNAQLFQQMALLRWLSSQTDDDRMILTAVTGIQVGRELLNRFTGQEKVDAYKRECILSISEFLRKNPRALQADINAEVEKRVLVFAAQVKALETASIF
ncbi:uncharacterized protein LOC114555427 [Perca flavescens]|uniref:uncharacterized protein LOC114555427 n=1 Tax=Perca flavescens TaxID=8167 RepID=UPI00106DEA05|nr:uncharacterized protein LOC114555427 [Perca flavescens]